MKKNYSEMVQILDKMHPDAECELDYKTPFELLVAVMLSQQCTDKRVNMVTDELFKIANTPETISKMDLGVLEKIIAPCGLYHAKATNIKNMANVVLEKGYVPDNREELMSIPGIGRKTANVMMSEAFHKNAIAVDTHVFRVANRIGIANANSPEKTEEDLMRNFDEQIWSHLHHLLIFHGRYTCKAINPNCEHCDLKNMCKYYKNR